MIYMKVKLITQVCKKSCIPEEFKCKNIFSSFLYYFLLISQEKRIKT